MANIFKGVHLEELHAAIMEQAPDGIVIMDMGLSIVYANPQACSQLGYSLDELLGARLDLIERQRTMVEIEGVLALVAAEGGMYFESLATRKNGSTVPLGIRANMVEVEGEKFVAAVTRDISEQKQIAQQLEGERSYMDALMDNFPDSIYFKDLDCRLVRVNQKLVSVLGAADESEIIGKTDIELLGEEFGRLTMAVERQIIETGESNIGQVEERELEDGSIYWSLTTKVPLKNEEGEIIGIAGVSREINEIKKTEETLRIRENQLSVASQIAGIAYWEYDVEENLFTFNDYYYDVYHTSIEEEGTYQMTPEVFAERFLFPEDRQLVAQQVQKAITTDDPDFNGNLDHRIRYPDGSVGYVTVRYFVVKNKQGQTIRTFGATQNITERLQAEKTIRDSEAQLSVATKIAKLGYWEYDRKTDLITFSEQFYQLLGYQAEELGGYLMTPTEYGERLLTPQDMEHITQQIVSALDEDKPVSRYFEQRIKYSSGELGYGAVRFVTVPDEKGTIYKAIGIYQDINDRKKAEMALIESEANLQKAFEIAAIGAYKYHIAEDTFEWDQSAIDVFDIKAEQVPRNLQEFLQLIPAEDLYLVRNEQDRVVREGTFDMEVRFIAESGFKWLRFKGTREYNDQREPTFSVGVVQDITERKEAETELTKYREQLEELVRQRTAQLENTNKDLEAFAYSISHDLRAPLRHINGFSNMLKRRLPRPIAKDALKYITLINEASRRMGTMIDGLLHFSRLGRHQIQTSDIDLNQLIPEIIEEWQSGGNNRPIKWNLYELPIVSGDAVLLKVAFGHLISNALKYTQKEPEAVIEIGTDRTTDSCTVYIKDNGVGFDMQYADQIFGVFQRLHREEEFEGTGIGLANVQQIIKRHGGTIYAQSEEGLGATFFISFKSNGV